jgi:hypothetical protein
MSWFRKKQAEPKARTEHDDAADEMKGLEDGDDVPRDPRDWPSGKAKYLTYGNVGDEAYGTGATGKLSPAEVTHNPDGSVSVGGEVVDDPARYKGKPITGGIIDQLTKHSERNKELREEEERRGET